MLTYKAMYKFLDEGIHAEVLDFPDTISFATNLQEARRLLASALVDMSETNLMQGESLPKPDPSCTDFEADLEEPIHLLLTATHRVRVVPEEDMYEALLIAELSKQTKSLWLMTMQTTALIEEKYDGKKIRAPF